MKTDCLSCGLWDQAAIENGYAFGMCEECFNKLYVSIKLPYDPNDAKTEDRGPKTIIQTCGDWE
jgi:hypothetical protein